MKNEYGRSMIEMLGVLAIIGVLSIGGLAGYTMAMNRHKANNLLDYVARCGVIAQTKGMGAETFDAANDTCDGLMNENLPTTITAATIDGTAPDITIALTYASGADNVAKAVEARSNNQVTITDGGKTFTFNN